MESEKSGESEKSRKREKWLKYYAQRHSKASECRSPRMREWKVESEKSGERGKYRTRGQNVRNDCKTEKHYAQRLSKVSESGGCPAGYAGREGVSQMGENLKSIMLNDTPKCRNTSPTSPPSPTGTPLNDTPKCRSEEARECGSVPRLRVPRMRERKSKSIVLNRSPKCRSRLSRMRLLAVQNVQNGKVRIKTGKSEYSSSGATY